MAKPFESLVTPGDMVRTRRAYFDCRFGQLHVRTAFPTTGGFDEGVTLFCLHPSELTSRSFGRFLPQIAADRSVYAPDLPGCGESDAAPTATYVQAADAVADLAADLRLRQIDLLGFGFGAAVALALAAAKPDLVRRVALVAALPMNGLPEIGQETLVMRVGSAVAEDLQWIRRVAKQSSIVDLENHALDLFDAAPQSMAKWIGDFLRGGLGSTGPIS